MSRNLSYNGIYALTLIFVIALYISDLVIPIKVPEYSAPFFLGKFTGNTLFTFTEPWISISIAAIFIVGTGFMLMRFSDSYSTGFSHFVPMIFIILTLTNPYSVYLSPFHIAAFLLVPSFHCFFRYGVNGQNITNLFISNFLIAVAICFCPHLAWLVPVILVSGITMSDDKPRYVCAFILSLAMPFGMILSALYLVYGIDTMTEAFPAFASNILNFKLYRFHVSLATLCRIAALSIFAIISILTILKNMERFKISKYKVYARMILILTTITVIALFSLDLKHPWSIIAAVPLSITGNEVYNTENLHIGKRTSLLTIAIILLITVERITYFIK